MEVLIEHQCRDRLLRRTSSYLRLSRRVLPAVVDADEIAIGMQRKRHAQDGLFQARATPHQSTLAPDALTIFAHLGISALIYAANCAGVLPMTSKP